MKWSSYICTVLCHFRNNINFIITICNKSKYKFWKRCVVGWKYSKIHIWINMKSMQYVIALKKYGMKRKNFRHFWWILIILIFLESKESGQTLRSRKVLSTCIRFRTNLNVFCLLLHHASSCSILFDIWKSLSAGNSRLALDSYRGERNYFFCWRKSITMSLNIRGHFWREKEENMKKFRAVRTITNIWFDWVFWISWSVTNPNYTAFSLHHSGRF